MARSLKDFALAQEIIQVVRKEVASELDRRRPKPRYARVQSINPDDRSCTVSFIGEGDNPVRVPYGSVAPAAVGQEVRIGGTADDRRIEDVRGPSDVEDRTMTLEEQIVERQFAMTYARLAVDMGVGATVVKLPFTSTPQAPLGIETDSVGGWRAPVSGYYELDAKVASVGTNRLTEARTWLQIKPVGTAAYDIDYDNFYVNLNDGAGAVGRFSTKVSALWYMNAGDIASVNHWNDANRSVFAVGSYFKMRLIGAIPQAQFPEQEG